MRQVETPKGGSSVGGFFLRVLLWLPLAFFAWYFTAPVLTVAVGLGAEVVLQASVPTALHALEPNGYTLDVITNFTLADAGIHRPETTGGLLAFAVNPLIYEYGIPLYFGLVLATPTSEARKLASMGIGLVLLLPVAAFGTALDIWKSLAFDFGPQIGVAAASSSIARNVLALSYQLGYLILPAVSPLILWMVLHRDYVAELSPAFSAAVSR